MSKDIKELIAKQLNIDVAKVDNSSRIVEDLGADSLDVVEMLMTLEDEMGITVSDEEALTLKTVEDIQKLVDARNE